MTTASTVFKIRADNKTQRAFKEIDSDLNNIKNGAISLTGKLAGLAGAAGMGLLIKNQMKLAKETQAWSNALGINIETLSAWNYAAKEVGLEGDKMSDLFKDISEKLGDSFANNAGEAVEVMQRLNLNMADMAAMSPDQQLLAIANSLDQVGTRAEKIQILESMGSDLSKMLPLLDDNAAGLHKLMREAEDMGAVMSQSEADGLKKMNDTMRKISASTDALSQSFVLAFGDKFASAISYVDSVGLPALKFMAEKLGLVRFEIESLAEMELEARLGDIIGTIADLNSEARSLLISGGMEGGYVNKVGEIRKEIAGLEGDYAKLEEQLNKVKNPANNAIAIPDMPRVGGFVAGENSSGGEGDAKAEAAAIRDQERLTAQFERLQLSMMSEKDALAFHLEEKQLLIDDAFFAGDATHLERNEMRAQLEAEHQAKLTEIERKGLTDREKFEAMSMKNKTKMVMGELVSLTAGVAQSNKSMFKINKIAATANAVISMHAGVMKAWEMGPILGPIMAPIVFAAGMANIGAIKSTSFSGGSGGGGGSASGGIPPSASGTGINDVVGTVPMNSATATPEAQSGTLNFYINGVVTQEIIDDMILPAITDAVNNRDVIIFAGDSRQAQEIKM